MNALIMNLDKRFKYRQKFVYDLPVGNSTVRLWSADGTAGKRKIEKAFLPLLKRQFVFPYVALMPDFHSAEGAMVGSVIPTRDVILPAVIGGDIGCGVTAVRLPLNWESVTTKLSDIHTSLQAAVPTGSSHNTVITERVKSNKIWDRSLRSPVLTNRLGGKLIRQFGSLGSGNHFIEILEDNEYGIWVMLHSGSRALGVAVRDYYLKAGESCPGIEGKLYSKIPHLAVGSELAGDYLTDLEYVLEFARESRREMLLRVLEVLSALFGELEPSINDDLIAAAVDVAHNYIAEEEHFDERLFIHRKGAIRVRDGECGLIPGSMGSASFVVEGRGNEFSFCSCSHGAGRSMSRGEAFRRISEKNFRDSMRDVVYEYSDQLRDEAPAAYKSIARVMRAQKDLVAIRHKLQPLLSVKGER